MLKRKKKVLIVVAHPDDETLFAGGTILLHSLWDCHVITACRASDNERRSRFHAAMSRLGIQASAMGDLDDGPEQIPLLDATVRCAIQALLQTSQFDLIVTHALNGEYTRHRRHEEVSRAIVGLWESAQLACDQLWMFAYADSGQGTPPVAVPHADFIVPLPQQIIEAKQKVLSLSYNFSPNSWEARNMPIREAFWCFDTPQEVALWEKRQLLEGAHSHAENGRNIA